MCAHNKQITNNDNDSQMLKITKLPAFILRMA